MTESERRAVAEAFASLGRLAVTGLEELGTDTALEAVSEHLDVMENVIANLRLVLKSAQRSAAARKAWETRKAEKSTTTTKPEGELSLSAIDGELL